MLFLLFCFVVFCFPAWKYMLEQDWNTEKVKDDEFTT